MLALGIASLGSSASLPPLIAQAEFPKGDALCVAASITAFSQATNAFAPAVFGEPRAVAGPLEAMPVVFVTAAAIYLGGAGCYLAGVDRRTS